MRKFRACLKQTCANLRMYWAKQTCAEFVRIHVPEGIILFLAGNIITCAVAVQFLYFSRINTCAVG